MFDKTQASPEYLTTLSTVLPSALESLLPVLLPSTSQPLQGLAPQPTVIVIVLPVLMTATPPSPPALPPPRRLTLSGEPDRRFLTGINRTERQRFGDSHGALTRAACECP